MSAESTHDPVAAPEEDRVDLLAEANFTNVLVVLLLDLQDLSELLHLLLQPPNLLLHSRSLSLQVVGFLGRLKRLVGRGIAC